MEEELPMTISDIEAVLVREGEQGPVACANAHESLIELTMIQRGKMMKSIAEEDAIINPIIKSCPLFGHRMCAHGLRFGAGVYENELKVLAHEGHLELHQYYFLKHKNEEASRAIQALDEEVRQFAQETGGDRKRSLEKQPEWKRKQVEIWNTLVNPLRERLLEVVKGPEVSKEKRTKAWQAVQSELTTDGTLFGKSEILERGSAA
jgi:hypothetical protein